MTFKQWIHHLLDPHCQQCADERVEHSICKACEAKDRQIESDRIEKQKLLDAIIQLNTPKVIEKEVSTDEIQPVMPKRVSWSVRKQMLEAEDRHRAKLMREAPQPAQSSKSKSIEELEKELGVDDAS